MQGGLTKGASGASDLLLPLSPPSSSSHLPLLNCSGSIAGREELVLIGRLNAHFKYSKHSQMSCMTLAWNKYVHGLVSHLCQMACIMVQFFVHNTALNPQEGRPSMSARNMAEACVTATTSMSE